ncbi:hypothetical protein HET69_28535 [Streptomyces sp. CJ_13]|uniref:hypothetical protein n=1 Tax=Streptomyces sp. CJ_13 TaxID=2724943 RepID=UPI001BDC07C2|nr:hypothetical protein [Streptomyces sp. CJ_13]MBT1187827.1 hypothetical protein [Streptomyces sp. CJ_13]
MSSWSGPERDVLVRLVLLELFEQAMDRDLGEVSDQEGGRPSGRPPAGVQLGGRPSGRPPAGGQAGTSYQTDARIKVLYELTLLLERDEAEGLSGAEQRRVAELIEFFDKPDVAFGWWEKAAASGDEDAKDYLEILREEMELEGMSSVSVQSHRHYSSALFVMRDEIAARNVSSEALHRLSGMFEKAACVTSEDLNQMIRDLEEYLARQVTNGGRLI